MKKGRQCNNMQWRQDEPVLNTDTNMVELTTPHSIEADIYYTACEQIDRHNRCLQESLDIKKLGAKDWSKRFNLSVFAMNVGWSAQPYWYLYLGQGHLASIAC